MVRCYLCLFVLFYFVACSSTAFLCNLQSSRARLSAINILKGGVMFYAWLTLLAEKERERYLHYFCWPLEIKYLKD